MFDFTLRTTATPTASRKLAKAALSVLTDFIGDKEQLFNFDLALTEACANVVRHAYGNTPPGEISLHIDDPHFVEISISDWGRGFPAWPMDVKNAEPHAEGGRGLFIMSELCDDFHIQTHSGKKTIHLKKFIEEKSWKTLP